MKTALIITGGDFSVFEETEYDFVYACDKGVEYSKRLNITPDVILGDFDSYDEDFSKSFPEAKVLRFPVEKDDTDTMLAIKDALSRGYMHIIIVCGLGKRMDHLIANIESLHYIAAHGGVGEIISEKEHLMTFSDYEKPICIKEKPGYSLSLFSLTDSCKGLTISGAKYNTDGITLTNSFPLGHGNSILEKEAVISITEGILLIVESLKD